MLISCTHDYTSPVQKKKRDHTCTASQVWSRLYLLILQVTCEQNSRKGHFRSPRSRQGHWRSAFGTNSAKGLHSISPFSLSPPSFHHYDRNITNNAIHHQSSTLSLSLSLLLFMFQVNSGYLNFYLRLSCRLVVDILS